MTEEELLDLVNAKAYRKEALKKQKQSSSNNVSMDNSLEHLLRSQGIL